MPSSAPILTTTRQFMKKLHSCQIHIELQSLHQLPVCKRIVFKLTLLVYICQHRLAPLLLTESCMLASLSVLGQSQLFSQKLQYIVWVRKTSWPRVGTIKSLYWVQHCDAKILGSFCDPNSFDIKLSFSLLIHFQSLGRSSGS